MRRSHLLLIACVLAGLSCIFNKASAQSSGTATDKITEVYGTFVSQLSADQLAWINNCLERCSIEEQPYIEGETLQNISTLTLNNKYTGNLTADSSYNAAIFNPLKYSIDFFNKKDQRFRIFNTGYVLKVEKKD